MNDLAISWKRFDKIFYSFVLFNILLLLVIYTFDITSDILFILKLLNICFTLVIVVWSGKLSYIATKKQIWSLVGISLFIPIPLLNILIFYLVIENIKKRNN